MILKIISLMFSLTSLIISIIAYVYSNSLIKRQNANKKMLQRAEERDSKILN